MQLKGYGSRKSVQKRQRSLLRKDDRSEENYGLKI